MHASCSARTDGDYDAATGYAASDFEDLTPAALAVGGGRSAVALLPEAWSEAWPALRRNKQDRIPPTIGNVLDALACEDMSTVTLCHDTFTGEDMISWKGATPQLVGETTNALLRVQLELRGFEPIRSETMRDAMNVLLERNSMDSAQQWLAGLQWDGIERCELFWQELFGVEASPYALAVGLYTWSALAARVLEPGAKTDMVPVLVGLQAAGKTSAIEALAPAPRMFGELDLSKKDDDLARQIKGKLVCELAELSGLSSRQSESIKAWISRRVEEWVPKYREKAVRYGRRCLFFGTSNTDEILDDDTGERRWLPMRVGQVDVAAVVAERDQLWAEGAYLFKRYGVMWQGAYSLAKAEHAGFKVVEAWHEQIVTWLSDTDFDGAPRGDAPFQTNDVFDSCLHLRSVEKTKPAAAKVRKVLTALGYVYRSRRVERGFIYAWGRDVTAAVGTEKAGCDVTP